MEGTLRSRFICVFLWLINHVHPGRNIFLIHLCRPSKTKLIWHQNPIGKNTHLPNPSGRCQVSCWERYLQSVWFHVFSASRVTPCEVVFKPLLRARRPTGRFLLAFFLGFSQDLYLKPVQCSMILGCNLDVSSKSRYTGKSRYTSSYPPVIDDCPGDYSWTSNFFEEWESYPKNWQNKVQLFFPRWTGKELAYSKRILACIWQKWWHPDQKSKFDLSNFFTFFGVLFNSWSSIRHYTAFGLRPDFDFFHLLRRWLYKYTRLRKDQRMQMQVDFSSDLLER